VSGTSRSSPSTSSAITSGARSAGEIDAASEDVLIDVVRKLEEQHWMIRAQFETG
jgi:hypothetical protein